VEGLRTVVVPCGALWCIAVQCGNIVEGLRTIAVHCGVMYMLWKAYRLLRYLAVAYNALRCTVETLQKACRPLRCIVVWCVHCGRLTNRYGTFRCLMLPCGHCSALRKCCRRLADDCGALWCGVYVVDNLRTVMVPCSALRFLAVRCIALQKRGGRLLDHCGALCAVHC